MIHKIKIKAEVVFSVEIIEGIQVIKEFDRFVDNESINKELETAVKKREKGLEEFWHGID